MWHVVCGDNAAEGVTRVVGESLSLQIMRDDLAVGPLQGVDQPPCSERAAFWQGVWPAAVQPAPDFAQGLSDDASWLMELGKQANPVAVWHGDSASEQLLLARVAAALLGSELALFEVPCGSGDSSVAWRRAVAMHAPDDLLALYQPKLVSPARRQQLAAQWQQVLAANALIRRWREGQFFGEDYSAIDSELLAACGPEYKPLARVMGQVMGESDGFFASDFFLFWRARELAGAGRLSLSASSGHYQDIQVRL